jgi:cytochrome c2
MPSTSTPTPREQAASVGRRRLHERGGAHRCSQSRAEAFRHPPLEPCASCEQRHAQGHGPTHAGAVLMRLSFAWKLAWIACACILAACAESARSTESAKDLQNSGASTSTLDTALIFLDVRPVNVAEAYESRPFGPHWVGAIAAVGDELLVLNAQGEIVRVRSDGSKKRIESHYDNHFDEFNEYAYENGYKIWPNNFRFTDILVSKDQKSLYLSTLYWHNDRKCFTMNVVSARYRDLDSRADWRKIFESSPCLSIAGPVMFTGNESGGKMAEYENDILLTVGHFGYDGLHGKPSFPRLSNNHYGKVVRIKKDGSAAEIFTSGHRNQQGLTVAANGNVYATEHGPQGGDELNLLYAGKDYGWPDVTLGTDYGEKEWPRSAEQASRSAFEEPLFAWVPSIGPTQVVEVTSLSPRWKGDLLVGSLRAKSIMRLKLEQEHVLYSESIPMGERIRDMAETSDGRLAVLLDTAVVKIIKQIDGPKPSSAPPVPPDIEQLVASCSVCHSFHQGVQSATAPNLWGIVDRPVASTEYEQYSDSLKEIGGVWTEEKLRQFLAAPAELAPGSVMAAVPSVADDEALSSLIGYLGTLKALPNGSSPSSPRIARASPQAGAGHR